VLLNWFSPAICIGLLLASAGAQDANTSTKYPGAIASVVKLEPESLDFGSHPVGTETAPKTISVTNTGKSTIYIADILTSGIDFNQTNNCVQSLAIGASCSIQVTFKPATTGERTATLHIDDSDLVSPQRITLTGIGQ
jgi:hypothetical protein